ncbi:MAG TPA: GntR family transcriptional regulator [Gammaproteobacteria bacterium]
MKRIVPTPSRAEQAYQAILDQICDGALAPGTHLVQEQLAARLGVSRQPIQQAMARLKSDGLVEELGARGLYVAPLDLAAMDQHYAIRVALDELAVRLAAGRAKASPGAAAAIARDGEAILATGEAAVAAGDVSQMVRHDVAFHRFLYAASGNDLLAGTAEPHWRYLRRVMGEVLRFAEPGQAIWQQHREILEAVVAGDAVRAIERTRRHVGGAAERLKRAFDEGRLAAGPGAPARQPG